MKKKILTITLIAIGQFLFSQSDKFGLRLEMSFGVLPAKLSGTTDVGDGITETTGTNSRLIAPEYKRVDTTSWSTYLTFQFGTHIPIIKKDKWSTGVEFNIGFGAQSGIIAAEGFNSFIINLPQYLYYTRNGKKFGFSIKTGPKLVVSKVPYTAFLLRADIVKKNVNFGIYMTPMSTKYYRLLTNGTLEPFLKIYDYGIVVSYKLGRN